MKSYYQSGKLIDRINWDTVISAPRYAGGHDTQMKGLLKEAIVLGHWNEGDYQGQVATCLYLLDTQEVVIFNDYYGSCSGCDAWEDAGDDDVKRMCKQLAGGAFIFKNIEDCKKFLEEITEYNNGWQEDVCKGLLSKLKTPDEKVRDAI